MEQLNFKLPVFEGPLDLLLYLISKHKIDITDIPISQLLEQYLEQLNIMRSIDMEVTSDFLQMAAQLLYIKSKTLLPKYEEEEEDPKEKLQQMLIEYQKYKCLTEFFAQGYLSGSQTFVKKSDTVKQDETYKKTHDSIILYSAYKAALARVYRKLPPPFSAFKGIVGRQIYSVNTKVVSVLRRLIKAKAVSFRSLFCGAKTKSELVATFLAVLELSKNKKITIGNEENGDYRIKILKNEEK